jgi:methyl-accepting chemotaxis protein
MQWYYNLKISAKLIIGFIIVALIAGLVGAVGLINLYNLNQSDTELYEENTLGTDYAGNAAVFFQRVRYNAIRMSVVGDIAKRDESINKIADYSSKADEYLKKYEDGIIEEADQKIFNEVKPLWEEYKSLIDGAVKMAQAEQYDQAKDIVLGDASASATSLQDAFDKLMEYNTNAGKTRSSNNTQVADNAITVMIIIVIAGVVIAVTLGVLISRIISNPVKKMVEAADKLAVGDINVNIEVKTKDEIGRLAKSLESVIVNTREHALVTEKIAEANLTVDVKVRSENDLLGRKLSELVQGLNKLISNIISAAEQVASGSKQVADSSMALSQGATEQASSVEELTASLEEISSQTKMNAQNAGKANELADNAKSNAALGNSQMKDMLKAMDEINVSSSNIYKIIKVIDDIAFQTNILALNAAVEAARAGQYGKGFAVVAEEVRTLAARSANAAKETTDLIEGSIKKVEAGTKIANETAGALNNIVKEVEKVADLVKDIAEASNEQSTGIEQINQGIMQVSQVVQTNSATSEEGAAASEELSSQAELMRSMVSKFKLKKVSDIGNMTEEINPEVLKMLESMYEKKNAESKPTEGKHSEPSSPGYKKIALSDKEFGKY